jgi:phage shock protein A
MTLLSRIERLFKADVHGVLDWLEDPEATLKQSVRDMEAEIAQGEQRLAELSRRADRLQSFVATVEAKRVELTEQIDICFEEDNPELARRLIRRKLEAEKRLQAAANLIADITAKKDAQQQQLKHQREQLEAIVEKMQLFVDKTCAPTPQESLAAFESASVTVSDEEVDMAFLHEKRLRAQRRTPPPSDRETQHEAS